MVLVHSSKASARTVAEQIDVLYLQSVETRCKWWFQIGNSDKCPLCCKWFCLFLEFSTYTEQRLVYLLFQVNILYWETIQKAFETYSISLCHCPSLLLDCYLPPWCQEGRKCSCAAPLPVCYPQLMLQQGVVVRLNNLIFSPPILGLYPGNDTTKSAWWGQKGIPLLSVLLCGFYVCSRADSTEQKISSEVICLIVDLLLGSVINSEHVSLLYY